MGKYGILNVVSTPNLNINIDEEGVVPSGCGSEYIIAVSGSDSESNRVIESAYSKVSVDLLAPAKSILSTATNNTYRHFDGTSLATPMVAGAIGLSHTIMCTDLQEQFQADPSGAALKLKASLLSSVNVSAQLLDTIWSGGILNVDRFLRTIIPCDIHKSNSQIHSLYPNPAGSHCVVQFEDMSSNSVNLEIYNMRGQVVLSKALSTSDIAAGQTTCELSGLSGGAYFLVLRSSDAVSSPRSLIHF